MIFIRVDANQEIATGHLVRTLTIAEECVRRNVPVRFVVADVESEGILKSLCPRWEQFQISVLQTNYRQLEEELSAMKQLLEQEKPQSLLIDSYFVTEHYLTELGQYTKILYMDDLRAFDYPADVICNYDVIAPEEMPVYQGQYLSAGKTLLGATYTPLREQFKEVHYEVREKVSDVLLTTGGTDNENIAGKILEEALNILDQEVRIHVLVGALNKNKDWLKEQADGNERICLHEGVQNMAELMGKCDLALSAAGTTLYELCAVGVPTICFTIAPSQVLCAESFARSGAVIYEKDLQPWQSIKPLAANVKQRRKQSETMRKLVDGKGTQRIVDELLKG